MATALALAGHARALPPQGEVPGAPHPPPPAQGQPPKQTPQPITPVNNGSIGAGALGQTYVYTFALTSFTVNNPRSLRNDTDYVAISVAVNGRPPIKAAVVNIDPASKGGVYGVESTISNVRVGPNDHVVFSYSIVNTGYAANTVESDLQNTVAAAASAAAGAVGTWLGGAGGGIVGSGAGGWVIGRLDQIIFADCDGSVAAADHNWTGAQLATTAVGTGKMQVGEDDNKGLPSPSGCGANSDYDVLWSVTGKTIEAQKAP